MYEQIAPTAPTGDSTSNYGLSEQSDQSAGHPIPSEHNPSIRSIPISAQNMTISSHESCKKERKIKSFNDSKPASIGSV